MDAKRCGWARASRWSTLLLLVGLGLLMLAVPAAAQDGQEASISQSCNAGSNGSDGSDGSDGEDGSNGSSGSDGGSCSNQRRVVQQSAGGDSSRSINQSQSVGGNDDGDDGENRVRARSDEDRVRTRDDSESDDQAPSSADVSSDELDCPDFENQADAQAVLDEDSSDPNRLDEDDDDRACEDEFTQAVSGAPEGGVQTGGGGTLAGARTDDGSSALAEVARLAGPPLALVLIVVGLLGLRRGRTA